MRVQSLTLAAAGLALLAPTTSPAAPHPSAGALGASAPRQEGSVRAADLLARIRDCTPVSRGRYRPDDGAPATIPVCGTDEAVFWTADMDIDCDGRPGPECNSRTDPLFSDATAYQQSDGRNLSAETLPYIVVPGVSGIWDHRDHGVGGGSVAAVVYQGRVQYAVVGDTGPSGIIGEASYATAKALGIRADPRGGGTPFGVTYIVFKHSRATPIESHASAVETGERLARLFVRGTTGQPRPPEEEAEEEADEWAPGGLAELPQGEGGAARARRTGAGSEGRPAAEGDGGSLAEEPTGQERPAAEEGEAREASSDDTADAQAQDDPDAGTADGDEGGEGDEGEGEAEGDGGSEGIGGGEEGA
ncbi:hypothetical protein QF030_001349 [Streptomyces rishiriensis]|uniref:Secreted protein n=1 Tax=Streptomyces rishiriensis TaxID=68264 RepID=A0ABU0NJ77_STRRH|nr:hypothetical protein [Streptomyces rishiriensis]